MAKCVYIETTIASYLTARYSRDLLRVARQEITQEWWDKRRGVFDLYISAVVIEEASEGDPEAAERRLETLEGIPLLDMSPEVANVAEALIREGPLPETATDDAAHLALSAVHGMDFLLTWNCKHLANAEFARPVAALLAALGYQAPVVCTPQELLGE